MARAPRQADIAAAAGVSQTTVSLVLSGSTDGSRLAEATRQRVLAAAEQLGYVPDPVATRLASSRNRMLGVYTFATAFPTAVDGFYYPILAGIEAEAAALGQDLVLFTGTGGSGERPDHRAAIRRTRIADGCLFFGRHVPEEPIDWLLGDGFPLVYVGRRDELGGRIPFVGVDYVAASAEVVGRLAALGHRQIRYLRCGDDALSSTDREQGVLAALRTARLPVRRVVVRAEAEAVDAGLISRWVADGVTAVVVEETDTGDLSAAALAAVESAGLVCPRDLSLAVLGQPKDRPDVSGFEVPRWELGRRSVRLLVDQITGARRRTDQQLLACRPVPGSTVGAAPTAPRR
ncbi:transcriptional regulator, LacI family [Kribbella flavida DSM 17836]|uniref:Transcriptional regulator, LacI family n=1 Tax=Kribbella flavida (strain DSM 17836 / JCM 10339 / NBRC 14399) TaxID=479435 RepID=D2PP78_KRIFD|nr:LacI family DNA-binding transcriptional regulator [Kribbella flavida]ADB34674.1 transcriptional regulator, LacI family [Kribbella flavida DSM 17836]